MLSTFRTLRTALRALRRNVMRSVLTCLGIIIGIAAVIAMTEIGQGSSYAIQQSIASLGANVIQIDPSDSTVGGVSSGAGGKATLTPDDCDAIRRECEAVRYLRALAVIAMCRWFTAGRIGRREMCLERFRITCRCGTGWICVKEPLSQKMTSAARHASA